MPKLPKRPKRVASRLKEQTGRDGPRRAPAWKGPTVDGITQSLLSRWLVCRERFRVLAIEGWQPAEGFEHRIEYGQMWHECEEALAAGRPWQDALWKYSRQLVHRYHSPSDRAAINRWYEVCKLQFPIYVEYWAGQKDVRNREPLFQERVFCVDYPLPSGRVVKLKGKWDAVDRIKKEGIYLQENKTKGDIKEEFLRKQLHFDLQTMIYVSALRIYMEEDIRGIRYNVIRRPLSGGRGSIKPRKGTKNKAAETMSEYWERLASIIKEDPGYFFMRWKVKFDPGDIDDFNCKFLTPALEQLCNWYEWVTSDEMHGWGRPNQIHWQFPYGVYNPLADGRMGDLDNYLMTGNTSGLQRVESLFPELET